MAHLSHKHFNSYKEGVNLEFLRDYCIEHGETRLMKRGEVFGRQVNHRNLWLLLSVGALSIWFITTRKERIIVQALLLRASLWLTIRIAFLARSQRHGSFI